MANRIVGNVYVIDSGTIALGDMDIEASAITFLAADSNSVMELTYAADTTDVIVTLQSPFNGRSMVGIAYGGKGWSVNRQLFVKTISEGTGYIFLS